MKQLKKRGSRIVATILICLTVFLAPAAVLASEGTVTGDFVNIRSGPGTDYSRVGLVPKGTDFTVLETSGDWYKANFANGSSGWIANWLTQLKPEKSVTTVQVNVNSLTVRSGAGTSFAPVAYVNSGTVLTVLAKEGDWYRVKLADGRDGYVAGWLTSPIVEDNSNVPLEPQPQPTPEQPVPQPETPIQTAVVTATSLNLRSGPGTNHGIVGSLSKGNIVTVVSKTGDWLKVKTAQGLEGYVAGWLVQINTDDGSGSQLPVQPGETPAQSAGKVVVIVAKANIRSANNTKSALVGSALKGTTLDVLGDAGGWYNVRLPDGKVGWIAGWLVQQVERKVELTDITAVEEDGITKVTLKGSAPLAYSGQKDEYNLNLILANAQIAQGLVVPQIDNGSLSGINLVEQADGTLRVNLALAQPLSLIQYKAESDTNSIIVTIIPQRLTSINWSRIPGGIRVVLQGIGRNDYRVSVEDGQSQANETTLVAMADNLNVRSGPGSSYGSVGQVSRGTILTLLGQENDWYKVKTGTGLEGYVASWLVEKRETQTSTVNSKIITGTAKLIVDLPNTVYPALNKTITVGDGAVKAVRASQYTVKPYTTRVVLDLSEVNGFNLFYNSELQEITLELMDPVLYGKTIVIDPGHGGYDPGATGVNGTREKDVNLRVALILQERLREVGANPILTRYGDKYATYSERVETVRVNNAQAFVSIHHNSSPTNPNASGVESYYYNGKTESARLAQYIQKELGNSLGITNRGVKKGDFHVIRETPAGVPSALSELSFLSNVSDERLANTVQFQNNAAFSIYRGLTEYFR